jgi:DNA ligase (NAD+)
MPPKRLNESLVAVLGELASIKTDSPFKSRAYTRAQESILEIQTDITDVKSLRGIPGIGASIIQTLEEYVATGKIAKLEEYKSTPIHVFGEIYGVGPKKAEELAKQGFKSIADLRQKLKNDPNILNATQKVGLQYYEDILERIPRKEIDEYHYEFSKVLSQRRNPEHERSGTMRNPEHERSGTMRNLAEPVEPANYEIVGSYRRGALSSGDIDVIFTSADVALFDQFLDSLIHNGVIKEVLSRGKSKCLVIACLPSHKGRRQGFVHRRVDFLYTTPAEFPFAVLYFTGSKGFNVVMRNHALARGYSMNEHGMTVKATGQPVGHYFSREADIFDFLGLEYKLPEERIDGRSVVLKAALTIEAPKAPLVKEPLTKEPLTKEPLTKEPLTKEPSPLTNVPTHLIKTPLAPKAPLVKEPSPKKLKSLFSNSPNSINIPTPELYKANSPKTKKNKAKMNPAKTKKNMKAVKSSPEALLKLFADTGIMVLDSLSQDQLSSMIIKANDDYYNKSTPLITDTQYDIIKEYIERKYPANVAIKEVGAKVIKNKVTLPYEMASMDKIKADSDALGRWTAKYAGPYVVSAKMDGVSGLYLCQEDNQSIDGVSKPRLYTRGDGKVGQDVSHLVKTLSLPCVPGVVVRGEFIMRKDVFESKYKATYATSRNLVAGIVNSRTIDERMDDLDFVAYELISPVMKPSKQMAAMTSYGFRVVKYSTHKTLSNESLSTILQDIRTNYDYETDGIIVANDATYPRKSGNPEHAFAFKMVIGDQMAEAKVVDVIWDVSQDGYLKPRIRIEPVNIAGVNIEYTTGFNGKFIEENGIGVGAVVRIIRSGDVIPYVREVILRAEKAKMPDVPYVWTSTHVDIVVENVAEDPAVKRKNVVGFFMELDIKGLGESNMKKIMDAGYDSVAKILTLGRTEFEKVFGKGKTGPALYEGIHERIRTASLAELMTASNMFGRGIGRKSVDALLSAHPDFLTSTIPKTAKLEILSNIGVKKNGEQFYDAIVPFRRFLEECGLAHKLTNVQPKVVEQVVDNSSPLFGKSVVMTKVRDADIIEFLKRVGATLDDAMKTTTFVLIVKDKGDVSAKTKYAEAKGIPVMTVEEFKAEYIM